MFDSLTPPHIFSFSIREWVKSLSLIKQIIYFEKKVLFKSINNTTYNIIAQSVHKYQTPDLITTIDHINKSFQTKSLHINTLI